MSVNEPIEKLTLTPGDVLVLRVEAGNQNQYSHAVDAAKLVQESLKERGLNNLVLVTTGSMGVGVDSEERMRDLNRAEQRAANAEAAALRLQERVAALRKQNAELVGAPGQHASTADLVERNRVLRGQIDVMTRTFIPREQSRKEVVAMMKWMREWCAELVDGWTGRRLAAAAAIRALPLPGEPQSFQHGRSGTIRAAKMFFIDEEATLPGDTYDVMKNVPMHANIDASISIISGLQPDGRLVAREDRDGCCIDGGRLEGVGIALHGDNADTPAIVQAPHQ